MSGDADQKNDQIVRRGRACFYLPACQFNLDAYHDQIDRWWGRTRVATVYFTQLMVQAFGFSLEQLGLKRNFIPMRPLPAQPTPV